MRKELNEESFREAGKWSKPIKDLKLTIAGTQLVPLLDQLMHEMERAGIRRIKPRFYLSTEWGVPFGTRAIAIPFYLTTPELTALHAERDGHVEGSTPSSIVCYLRHELGHVVNYAYRLYDREEWIRVFGSITQPYVEAYRPQPFSRRFVRHLPGWYAQKHPDEDWAETFAVWMTPGPDWRSEYAKWPEALAKLEFCDRTMNDVRESDPLSTAEELDEDVGDIGYSIDDYYDDEPDPLKDSEFPPGLDGALRAIFDDLPSPTDASEVAKKPAAKLIKRLQRELMQHVYLWTGHFPELTRSLVRHLQKRADEMKQVYPPEQESQVTVAFTTLVTALAMNHVHRGSYLP